MSTYTPNKKLFDSTTAQATAPADAAFQRQMNAYLQNGGSIEDALKGYEGELNRTKLVRGDQLNTLDPLTGRVIANGKPIYGRDPDADAKMLAFRNSLATDPLTGSRVATQEVQNNPLLKSLFGEGGLQTRLDSEEQKLAGQGYQLTPEDHTAYGQASGDIARLFGQQEQDLSKSLARRGLASAGSGAAGAGFSGLAGNKNEMLAKAQTEIADRRMQNTMQRLQQTRQLMSSLGTQAGSQIEAQYRRQLAGANRAEDSQKGMGGFSESLNSAHNSSASENEGHGLGDMIGGALTGGLTNALSGGVSSVLGAGATKLGGSLFGEKKSGGYNPADYSNKDWGGG
jgi:hypothetical protein